MWRYLLTPPHPTRAPFYIKKIIDNIEETIPLQVLLLLARNASELISQTMLENWPDGKLKKSKVAKRTNVGESYIPGHSYANWCLYNGSPSCERKSFFSSSLCASLFKMFFILRAPHDDGMMMMIMTRPDICHFFSTNILLDSIFLHVKFRDKTAWITDLATKQHKLQ